MQSLTSRDNPNIKKAVKLKKSAKYRKELGLFCAEGVRLCLDAVKSGAEIDSLFVTQNAIEKHKEEFNSLLEYSDNVFVITPELFSLISDTQSPQGFLCVIKTLDKSCLFDTIKNSGKFLALESLQDPGNLGTVLRSAEAFGVSGVILSEDSCDIYSPKVVRSSMGAVFRLPFIITASTPDFLRDNPQLKSFAAVVDSNAEKITEISFEPPCVAVIGNEGNGLRQDTVKACTAQVTIPMRGKAESLNASAAASIIMWEMMK